MSFTYISQCLSVFVYVFRQFRYEYPSKNVVLHESNHLASLGHFCPCTLGFLSHSRYGRPLPLDCEGMAQTRHFRLLNNNRMCSKVIVQTHLSQPRVTLHEHKMLSFFSSLTSNHLL